MADIKGYQGHAFTVYHRGEVRITPEAKTIYNEFDYMGQMIGLSRLPGERNADYRRRLLDVYVNRAGAHRDGLVNGITRELGLEKYEALTITPASSCPAPRATIEDGLVTLWRDSSVYWEFDTYSRDAYPYLSDLVTGINATGSFTASLVSGVDGHTFSTVLLHQDSHTWQQEEEIESIYRNKLLNSPVVRGTVRFNYIGSAVFSVEKTSESDLASAGDYYVDYDNGLVVSYSLPNPGTTCRYQYRTFPMTVIASPAILFDFSAESFKKRIFEQILQRDGTYANGLPTSEGIEFINELLAVKGVLWGE